MVVVDTVRDDKRYKDNRKMTERDKEKKEIVYKCYKATADLIGLIPRCAMVRTS